MGSSVVHYIVSADDVKATAAFYRNVFGWRISSRQLTSVDHEVSGAYTYVEAESGGITGGFAASDAVGRRGVVLVVEVDDLEATIERAERLGARRAYPSVAPERMQMTATAVTTASFELDGFDDPEGNRVYVIRHGGPR